MTTASCLSHRRSRERGAALLTAMIIVTLVATLASAMVWQQWRAVQVESAERARAQSAWILSGALDFAKLILRESKRSNPPTALTDPWATPLAEARLSTFLAADKSNTDDGPEAFLSGSISDANARYNLMNLSNAVVAANGDVELEILKRLCQTAGVDSSVAVAIAKGLRAAWASTIVGSSSAGAPLTPRTVSQLSWLGIDAASLQALEPYVVMLPFVTSLNFNTASADVLAAVVKVDQATAQQLVQTRQRTSFKDKPDFLKQLGAATPVLANIDSRSVYFIVNGRLRLADHVLLERSLLKAETGTVPTVLQRERVAGLDSGGN
jgi:general secretion pathway protein K